MTTLAAAQAGYRFHVVTAAGFRQVHRVTTLLCQRRCRVTSFEATMHSGHNRCVISFSATLSAHENEILTKQLNRIPSATKVRCHRKGPMSLDG